MRPSRTERRSVDVRTTRMAAGTSVGEEVLNAVDAETKAATVEEIEVEIAVEIVVVEIVVGTGDVTTATAVILGNEATTRATSDATTDLAMAVSKCQQRTRRRPRPGRPNGRRLLLHLETLARTYMLSEVSIKTSEIFEVHHNRSWAACGSQKDQWT
jgi:hypothetical protein